MSFGDLKDDAEAAAEIIVSLYLRHLRIELRGRIFPQGHGAHPAGADRAQGDQCPDQRCGFPDCRAQGCGNAFTLTQILGREPVTLREYMKKNLLG